MIAVTYPSLFGTTPDRKIGTWDELVTILSDHRENADKERAPLWSPVTLVPGGTRKNAAVAQVNALVFDVDGGTAYATAKAALADREWIAYSTFSHTPEEERFHLVVRLPDPVSGEAWAKDLSQRLETMEGAARLEDAGAGVVWFEAGRRLH
jgi:hypothetical protein